MQSFTKALKKAAAPYVPNDSLSSGRPAGSSPTNPVNQATQWPGDAANESYRAASNATIPGGYPQTEAPMTTSRPEANRGNNHDQTHPQGDARLLIQRLREELNRKEQDAVTLSKQVAHLSKEKDTLSRELRSLQARSFKSFGDARWMPLDHGSLVGQLEKVRLDITDLAKTYAADDLSEVKRLSPEGKVRLREDLSSIVCFRSPAAGIVDELALIKKAARLCLTALISRKVHKDVLDDPFFFMDDMLDDEYDKAVSKYPALKRRHNACDFMRHIFDNGLKYDEERAQIWRSDTIRLVNPYQMADNEEGNRQLIHMNKSVEQVCRRLPETMNHALLGLFLRPMQASERAEFMKELQGIFEAAGRLSIQLWSQRPALQCRNLSSLSHESFRVRSLLMEPHALHRRDDPEDSSMNGWLPKVVVHPAVLARGTHDADHYERVQVLAKAEVWLEAK